MKRDEFERAPRPTSERYFTRDELEHAWHAIRPLDSSESLDHAMELPVMAMVIRCAALGRKRAQQAIAAHGSLRPPRDAEIAQHVIARRLGKKREAARKKPAPARPDYKQLAAHDVDLFETEAT